MEPIARETLELLVELQSTETEANNITVALEKIPVKVAQLEKEIDEVTALVESSKNKAENLKKDYRELESNFETTQERVKKRKMQLDSVKSNKDYQALLKEIEDVKETGSRIEDEMLQCLDDIEAAEGEVVEAERRYSEKKGIIEQEKRELEGSAKAMRETLAKLEAQGLVLSDKLDPKLKKKYYDIKSRSGGVAIVSVNDAVCKGCHLNIPPQLYNELHKEDEIRLCPHCYRMIYVL